MAVISRTCEQYKSSYGINGLRQCILFAGIVHPELFNTEKGLIVGHFFLVVGESYLFLNNLFTLSQLSLSILKWLSNNTGAMSETVIQNIHNTGILEGPLRCTRHWDVSVRKSPFLIVFAPEPLFPWISHLELHGNIYRHTKIYVCCIVEAVSPGVNLSVVMLLSLDVTGRSRLGRLNWG